MLLNWLCCFRSSALSSFEKCRVRQWHVQQGDKTPHWEQNDSAENKIKIGLGTQQIYITVRSRVVSKQSGNNKSEAMTGPLYHMVVITMASIWQHSDGHVSYCKSCKKMKERKIISLLSKLFFSVLKGDCAFTFTVNTQPATQIWTDFVQQISNLLKGMLIEFYANYMCKVVLSKASPNSTVIQTHQTCLGLLLSLHFLLGSI